LLERIVSDLVQKEENPIQRMIEEPHQFESASWVSNRLCEFLPIAAPTKHKLMVLDDPLARLGVVHEYLRQQSVI
jgi:Lon protease-like protein